MLKATKMSTEVYYRVEPCRGQKRLEKSIKEEGEWVFGSTNLALKNAHIVDLCDKSSGFADFENTVDRGSAVIFDADSGLCLS